MGDAGAGEPLRQLLELGAIARSESDSDGARWDRAADTLTGGVDGLRDLRPMREVGADDDVVGQVCGGVAIAVLRREGPGVNGCCA